MLCFSSGLLLVKGLVLFLFSFFTGSDENFAQTGKPGNTFNNLSCCLIFFFSKKNHRGHLCCENFVSHSFKLP